MDVLLAAFMSKDSCRRTLEGVALLKDFAALRVTVKIEPIISLQRSAVLVTAHVVI